MREESRIVRIGARGSALAVRQRDLILAILRARFPGYTFVPQTVQTAGDRVQDRPIYELGDKGVFVRAIEWALLGREIDLAVHSLKDVPADVETPGLTLAAYSAREDPRDAWVSRHGATLEALPAGALVGTSSLRRRVQLRAARPDLVPVDIRGNVDTRLRKLDEGQYDALILAAAGLHRLGLGRRIVQYLPLDRFIPDPGQGIMTVQTRLEDGAIEVARAADDAASRAAALAERAAVRALGAGCHSPVGVHATVDGGRMTLHAMAATEGGSTICQAEREGPVESAIQLGRMLGSELLRQLER